MLLDLAYIVMALLTGVVVVGQTGVNSQTRLFLGSPVHAVLVSFVGGLVVIMVALLSTKASVPLAQWARMPIWMWLGGLCGVFIVGTNVLVVPRLGAALLTALAIAGQMVAALILDRYGAFGFPVHPISAGRLAGGALVLAGVVLIRWC